LNVWMPYHSGDEFRMTQWLKWAKELGTTGSHVLYLNPAKDVADTAAMEQLGVEAFGVCVVVPDYEGVSGWPQGPNSTIRQAGWYFSGKNAGPFLFLENDAIPLVPDWLDQLEAEYRQCGKPFMARNVPAFRGSDGYMVPEHMTGNMICPQDTPSAAPRLMIASDVAFDVYSAKEVLPKMHNTMLIQHIFNIDGKPPTFPTRESLSIIQHGAVLFHRVKDCSLIERLRERDFGSKHSVQGEPATGNCVTAPHSTLGTNPPVQIDSVIATKPDENTSLTIESAIAHLKSSCTYPLAKARIVKQLRAAGLIPEKSKKK
jgi:hypothetical protein